MTTLAAVQSFVRELRAVSTTEDLEYALADACALIGCRYFAMTQHLDFGRPEACGFRVHNYPESWVEWFDRVGLGVTDPIHRASHVTATGFRWSEVPAMIALTKRDHDVLAEARRHGLGDGFTVPANIPGEALGSCSFANGPSEALDEAVLPYAQLVGQYAFEAARRLSARRPGGSEILLTARQVECVMWVGRGKTDWEIARILGVSHGTVVEHLRHVRARYDASARAMLPVRALYDGALSFADLIGR
jgi:LuxR family quorum-sensing system transcriptional regulator CciR